MEIIEQVEEKEKIGKMTIANLIEDNEKDEADAIKSYNYLLEATKNSDLPKRQKEVIESQVYEIIGDELNHQDRLKMLYSVITDIKENKD